MTDDDTPLRPPNGQSPDDDRLPRVASSVGPIGPRGGASPLPFHDLQAPQPVTAAPPPTARYLAFGAILVGGLLGGLIGYGTGDLMGRSSGWALLGLLLGALVGAFGVGVVAALTLRAMNEWDATPHPEAGPGRPSRRPSL